MDSVSYNIYNTPVTKGVAIAWVNSYSAVVVKTASATLLFDPVGMEVPAGTALDLIAITHGHLDHWEPKLVSKIQSRTGSTVVAPPFLADKLVKQRGNEIPPTALLERGNTSSDITCGRSRRKGEDRVGKGDKEGKEDIVSLMPGDEIKVGATTVTALRCDHAAVEPLAFQVSTPDGLTVYLPGDTTPFHEMGDLPLSRAGSGAGKSGTGKGTERRVDVLCWMGTALTDGAKISHLVQPKIVLSYAITPPAAGKRAYDILTGLTSDIPFQPLDRHQVFLWPVGD
ncbi:MAG: hypothetical protein BZY75_02145 [SAR202 cluster bacterium Io17-Chloro-G7]|nr:MAG: hypothetical protein BZY75_02145 [SAR202 cluster bacterium Io17-Chloro-G7]